MIRSLVVVCALVAIVVPAMAVAGDLKGDYLEIRSCDVYTGPCFANGQGGLAGKDAMMVWNIERGDYNGVRMAGLKVAIVLLASDTLGFGGTLVFDPDPIRSVIIVDEKANAQQREALVQFATEHCEHHGQVVKVLSAPMEMKVDHFEMVGEFKAGDYAEILTRKINENDCVCRNEVTFYPPLCNVKNANAAYTLAGAYNGPGLGVRWSIPMTRSAFVATFSY